MRKKIKTSKILLNIDNPRLIKDDNFLKLKQSIQDFPDMLKARPIVIDKNNMVWGGNQRLQAIRDLGWDEVEVHQPNWSIEKFKEFMIKDNLHSGLWDFDNISANFDFETLDQWDFKAPGIDFKNDIDLDKNQTKEEEKNICQKCGLELAFKFKDNQK